MGHVGGRGLWGMLGEHTCPTCVGLAGSAANNSDGSAKEAAEKHGYPNRAHEACGARWEHVAYRACWGRLGRPGGRVGRAESTAKSCHESAKEAAEGRGCAGGRLRSA